MYLLILSVPISTLKVFFKKSATAFPDLSIPLIAQNITSTAKFHAFAIAPGTACQTFAIKSKMGLSFSLSVFRLVKIATTTAVTILAMRKNLAPNKMRFLIVPRIDNPNARNENEARLFAII